MRDTVHREPMHDEVGGNEVGSSKPAGNGNSNGVVGDAGRKNIPGSESEPCGKQGTGSGEGGPFSSGILWVMLSRKKRRGAGGGVDTRAHD